MTRPIFIIKKGAMETPIEQKEKNKKIILEKAKRLEKVSKDKEVKEDSNG